MTSDEKDRLANFIHKRVQKEAITVDVGSGTITMLLDATDNDDAAAFRLHGDIDLVATTDYVRGPKFTLYEFGYLALYDLGYYLAVANLSDVAAMGALPLGLLSVVRYPPDMSDSEFEEVLRGIEDAAANHGTQNVGGDIGEAERIILSGTALGAVAPGTALTRSGASPGDDLWVTGPVGNAGAAVIYFSRLKSSEFSLPDEVESELLTAWRRPTARLAAGAALSQGRLASSCQDISDGLRTTLEELARSSQVGFDVQLQEVPVGDAARQVAALLNIDPYGLALSASVDFELAFTAPRALRGDVLAETAHAGVQIQLIGVATDTLELVAVDASGHRPLPGVSWRQQPGDIAEIVLRGLQGDTT